MSSIVYITKSLMLCLKIIKDNYIFFYIFALSIESAQECWGKGIFRLLSNAKLHNYFICTSLKRICMSFIYNLLNLKKMKVTAENKVGQVVAEDYRAADIFKKHGIDFCCGGGLTIAEACGKKQIDQTIVLEELSRLSNGSSKDSLDFNSRSLSDLIEIIVDQHHSYVENNVPILKQYLKKVYAVHGQNHPELEEVLLQFLQSAKELYKHMKKEEDILFPFVKQMEAASESGEILERPELATVINEMLNEHENEGQRFARIQEITNDFQFPNDACNTYKVAFHKLKEFQNDLHLHIHLENNILFPKAAKLEKELFS
jgi:regulator of cell morphogenesis and NO signaling